jgi:hypothetical protein
LLGRFIDMRFLCAGALAAGVLCAALTSSALAAHAHAHGLPAQSAHSLHAVHTAPAGGVGGAVEAAQAAGGVSSEPMTDRAVMPGTTPYADRPWIEGYEPAREDELFRATYPVLPTHNILKIYVSDEGTYDAAGIRFSARVPHTMRDIDSTEMEREAVTLIRTAFDRFPDLQTLDVWATIPVDKNDLTSIESTVFSVSADRPTYLAIRTRGLSDESFLTAFGRVWLAPQVPR